MEQFASFCSTSKSSKHDNVYTVFLYLSLLETFYRPVLFSFSYKHDPILWSPNHQPGAVLGFLMARKERAEGRESEKEVCTQ